jgi:hypothetical protein
MKRFYLLLILLLICGMSFAQPMAGSGSRPDGADGSGRCAPIGEGDGILIALVMVYGIYHFTTYRKKYRAADK